ncbi:hypothetical protein NDI43_04170 [Microcoleus vaginatus GB2-A3]
MTSIHYRIWLEFLDGLDIPEYTNETPYIISGYTGMMLTVDCSLSTVYSEQSTVNSQPSTVNSNLLFRC